MRATYTDKDIITELRRVYQLFGKRFTRREYRTEGQIASSVIEHRFGGWQQALDAAVSEDRFTPRREPAVAAPSQKRSEEVRLSKEEVRILKEEEKISKHHERIRELEQQRQAFSPVKELEREWADERRSLVEKAEQKQVRYFKDKAHKIDLLGEYVTEAVKDLEPMTVVYEQRPRQLVPTSSSENCTLWFEFSDLQLGTKMTLEEMGGLNEHNWEIWRRKLEIWKTQAIEKIAAYDSQRRLDAVVLACLGDMVEGQDIFASQIWQIDRPVVDQATQGAEDTAAAFAEICLTFPHIKFKILEVFGNHGRIGKKGETPYANSMDKVYQRFLQLRLAAIREITNLTYFENESWFYFTQLYGWNHLLLHGDQGMSSLWSNRPTVNGLEKGITRYNQMLQGQVHFVHCGHFHNDWQLSMNMAQLLINGSFIGTSNFSASKMVASGPPVQVMHVFEPRVGLARTERIHLVDGDVRNPIKPKSIITD